jgi:macrolide transport system ATP-binding/permease protein
MRIWRSLRLRAGSLLRRTKAEEDLNFELEDHVAHETERYKAKGLSEEDARIAALRSTGGMERVKEECRDARSGAWLERSMQDIRYGWRTMRKNPWFSALAILSLALGIGANTAIYSVMDAIMMRSLPVKDPSELVILNWRTKGYRDATVVRSHTGSKYDEPGGGTTSPDFPWPAYEMLRDHNDVFSALFAFKNSGPPLNLVVHGQAEVGPVEFVSGNYFNGLGVIPAAGRLISASDDVPGAGQVAVISYLYWQKRFAGDAAAIGQSVAINNLPLTIIGVTAPEFFGVRPGAAPLVYIPLGNRPALNRNYGDEHDTMFVDPHNYWVDMMGRLRPGVTREKAEAQLATKFHQFALTSAANDKEKINLPVPWVEEAGSGVDSLRRQYSTPLFVLMTMVAFILAIVCANIANLLLARAAARRREIAVRLSLGAGRLRVLRQLLTESLMLALPGGVLGLGIATLGVRFLIWLLAGGRESFSLRAGLDWRILAFTMGVAFATGILFGLVPAIAATRVDVTPALKETRASAQNRGARHVGLSQILVIGQIALSLLLVLGAAIFVRTLANLHAVEIGFNQENVLTFSLDASQAGYKDAALRAFYAEITERFRGLPGVRAATVSDMPLLSNSNQGTGVVLPGAPKKEGRDLPSTSLVSVGPGFFETMELPILLGRAIGARDIEGAPRVAVVNEVFAKTFFPEQNAMGRQFALGSSEGGNLTVIGLAKNARYSSLKDAIPPVVYIPYLQNLLKRPPIAMTFELRTAGNPLSLAETIRKTVSKAAPRVPVSEMMTQTQHIDNTIVQERTFADLCSVFALLALAIACVGLYGTMAYAVARRTNEIGIRMALGAERRRIIWMVQREVLLLAVVGLSVGMLGAWGAASSIRSFVFGTKAADPTALAATVGILMAAAVLAGFAPAMRASRIDPLAALRHE